MKNISDITIDEINAAADEHAKETLGISQYLQNKTAAIAIKEDFKAGIRWLKSAIQSMSEQFVSDVNAAVKNGDYTLENSSITKKWTNSSQVSRTKFLINENILEVEFKSNGKVYHYLEFPMEMWEKLCECESIGSFINKEIKGKYEYKAVGEDTPIKESINLPNSSDL